MGAGPGVWHGLLAEVLHARLSRMDSRKRFRPWGVWVPLTVAVISAALAMYLAVWSAYDIVPGWHVDWLGSPRLSTGQIIPLLIGGLGVTATTAAILAGVGELAVVLPKQSVTVGVSNPKWLARGSDGMSLDVGGRNGDTFVARVKVDMILVDASGTDIAQYAAGEGIDLLPYQEFKNTVRGVLPKHFAEAWSIRLVWATERRRGLQHAEMPFMRPLGPPPP